MSKRTNTAVWFPDRKRWQINVQKDGKRKTFISYKPGRTGQREANAKADAWLEDDVAAPAELRVAEAWARFLEWRKEVSEIEYTKTESFGRLYLLPTLGRRKLSALSEQDLQGILDKAFRHPAGGHDRLSKKTLQCFLSYELQFARYCRRSRWTTLLPEDLRVPAAARTVGKSVLQIKDLITVMNVSTTLLRGKVVDDEYINYYRFQILTGLRPGELRGLRWDDIQGDICTIRRAINVHGEETHGKNENALRSFALTAIAQHVLEDQRARTVDNEYIFPMSSMHTYYGRWKKYQAANGIDPPISLYEMRHTFVSAAKTLPEGQLRQLVGHSKSMDTYGTYSHALSNDAEDTADALCNIFTCLLASEN